MDVAPMPTIEVVPNKADTALLGISTQDSFKLTQGDPDAVADGTNSDKETFDE
jgi:hypothetical protein